jgi:Ca2+-binding EF-hand superfamily protein
MCREFMLALAVISKRTPEDKLVMAFQLFDVDGNGWIDFPEMKRWVERRP